MDIELFSTSGCHLCEVAERLLLDVLPAFGDAISCYIVDIADDDALIECYGTRIPVLLAVSGQSLNWPFDADQLRSFLRGLQSSGVVYT